MVLEKLPYALTVCKVSALSEIDLNAGFCFICKTDDELSLVCRTEDAPAHPLAREDGWRGFRVRGVLDFSLIGILSRLTGILAAQRIGVFAVSTYNTDYILVKEASFTQALDALRAAGYTVTGPAGGASV